MEVAKEAAAHQAGGSGGSQVKGAAEVAKGATAASKGAAGSLGRGNNASSRGATGSGSMEAAEGGSKGMWPGSGRALN